MIFAFYKGGRRVFRQAVIAGNIAGKTEFEKNIVGWYLAAEIQFFPPAISEIYTFTHIDMALKDCILHNYVLKTLFCKKNNV